MAGKPLNRMDLRRQREAAEPLDPMEDEAEEIVADADEEEAVPGRKPKKKPKAAAKPKVAKVKAKAKPKTPRAPKQAARQRIVWVVLNDAFKPIATFEYNQKEAADARAAELTAKGKGTHFVQRSKEALADDAPGIGALMPRIASAPAKSSRAKAAVAPVIAPVVDEEEEIHDDEEDEVEVEEEEADDEE